MGLLTKKTEDEKAADAARKQAERDVKQREEAKKAFFRTPAGQARIAYERGDQVFQYNADVMSQQAIVIKMVGANTSQRTADPSVILNTVCNEGWELVNGSFVFIEQGQESRDKFMSSGQNVAIRGKVIGYYLFKRCETNRQHVGDPWDSPLAEDET